MPPINLDFNKRQPTENEILRNAIERLRLETEIKLTNVARQLYSLAILLKIDPEPFLRTFNDELSIDAWGKNLELAMRKVSEEQAAKKAEEDKAKTEETSLAPSLETETTK